VKRKKSTYKTYLLTFTHTQTSKTRFGLQDTESFKPFQFVQDYRANFQFTVFVQFPPMPRSKRQHLDLFSLMTRIILKQQYQKVKKITFKYSQHPCNREINHKYLQIRLYINFAQFVQAQPSL